MREFFRYIVLLLFFVPLCAVAQTGKWREMYKVKKKDTVYGIAKKYDITVDELREANPDMKMPGYELKHGDYIFIPFAKTASAVKAKARSRIPSVWASCCLCTMPMVTDGA